MLLGNLFNSRNKWQHGLKAHSSMVLPKRKHSVWCLQLLRFLRLYTSVSSEVLEKNGWVRGALALLQPLVIFQTIEALYAFSIFNPLLHRFPLLLYCELWSHRDYNKGSSFHGVPFKKYKMIHVCDSVFMFKTYAELLQLMWLAGKCLSINKVLKPVLYDQSTLVLDRSWEVSFDLHQFESYCWGTDLETNLDTYAMIKWCTWYIND